MFLIIICLLFLIVFISMGISVYIYFNAFYYRFNKDKHDCFSLPDNDQCRPIKDDVIALIKKLKEEPFEEVHITSCDNLDLFGRLYIVDENADFEIVFHGYKSCANHDCGGIYQLAKKRGHNVLLPDQRCHGQSNGKMITYGIKERLDCLKWCEYIVNRFPKSKIIISGVSMGASTVLLTSDLNLPKAVKGIIADCGYSSVEEIILKVAGEMRHNPKFIKPFLHLTTILFGGFGINKYTPIKSVSNTKLPILFIHGTDDRFVPYYMAEEMYSSCKSEKYLLVGENAGHGLTYFGDSEKYRQITDEFIKKCFMER